MDNFLNVCACIGPRNGEPYCNCTMVRNNIPRSEQHLKEKTEWETTGKQEFEQKLREVFAK
jgi:hypothetical protein